MIKNILFDFDGVIIDSMDLKGNAFYLIFDGYPDDARKKIQDYHNVNGGISRFDKIKFFYNKILNKEISEDKVLMYADKFSCIVKKKLTDKKYIIKETLDFIKNNYKKYNIHLVSATEELELKYITEKLSLIHYFISISGSPTAKQDNILKILGKYNYPFEKTIFIGDSINDYHAAINSNIKFFGYNNKTLKDVSYYYIERFNELNL